MSVVEIRTSSARDPDGQHFRDLVRAIDQVNRLGATRVLAMHGLAALGLVLWMDLVWPTMIPELLRNLAILAFAATAVGAVVAMVLESRWQRIQRRCMKNTDARILDGDDRHEHDRR